MKIKEKIRWKMKLLPRYVHSLLLGLSHWQAYRQRKFKMWIERKKREFEVRMIVISGHTLIELERLLREKKGGGA